MDIRVELITPNNELWEQICSKSLHIFHIAILPELVARFYSKFPKTNLSSSHCSTSKSVKSITKNDVLTSDKNGIFYYCEEGEMV